MNECQYSSEKHLLEKAAMEYFLPHYEERINCRPRIIKQERPDFVLEAEDGRLIGVEIAHLYYDDKEAQLLLGRDSKDRSSSGLQCFSVLLDNLGELVRKKDEKAKSSRREYPLILVIRVGSPIWTRSVFEAAKPRLRIQVEVFDEVWLLATDEREPGWASPLFLRGKSQGM